MTHTTTPFFLVLSTSNIPVVNDDIIELRRQLIDQGFTLAEIRHLGLEGLRGLIASLEPELPQAA